MKRTFCRPLLALRLRKVHVGILPWRERAFVRGWTNASSGPQPTNSAQNSGFARVEAQFVAVVGVGDGDEAPGPFVDAGAA